MLTWSQQETCLVIITFQFQIIISTFLDAPILIHLALKENAFLCSFFNILHVYVNLTQMWNNTFICVCVNLITSNMIAFCWLAILDTGFAFYVFVYIFYFLYKTYFRGLSLQKKMWYKDWTYSTFNRYSLPAPSKFLQCVIV